MSEECLFLDFLN